MGVVHRPARPAPVSWVPTRWELAAAAVFAGVLALGTVAAASLQVGRGLPMDAVGYLLVVLAAAVTVGLRRVHPVGVLVGSMALTGAYLLAGYPYGPVQLCMIIAMFEVARRCSPRLAALVCGIAAVVAFATVITRMVGDAGHPVLISAAWMGWIVLPWSLGSLARAVATAQDRSRAELVARVALEERMRMATEVHDIAGHGFAVVAMQAGVALVVFDEQPEQARTSLQAIQASSTKSLAELRTMLDTLHPGDRDPGLAALTELVDRVRAGGLPVRLDVGALDTALSDDVDAVAYRVVQESLTNVLRHAGPTTADVHIARRDDELVVQVLDGGRATARTPSRPGRGLTGMRTRVEDVGGRIEAGPPRGGGFRVAAHLPLAGAGR